MNFYLIFKTLIENPAGSSNFNAAYDRLNGRLQQDEDEIKTMYVFARLWAVNAKIKDKELDRINDDIMEIESSLDESVTYFRRVIADRTLYQIMNDPIVVSRQFEDYYNNYADQSITWFKFWEART